MAFIPAGTFHPSGPRSDEIALSPAPFAFVASLQTAKDHRLVKMICAPDASRSPR